MLRSRIYRRVLFAPITPDAIPRVIPRYHPLYEHAPIELLALIDDVFAHGFFRDWASFTRSAQQLCDEREPRLDEPLARAVFALHNGGADAPLIASPSSWTRPIRSRALAGSAACMM